MTKTQAIEIFKSEILSQIDKTDKKDKALVTFEWHAFTDSLCKNGDITKNQYNNWVNPVFCK